MSAFYLTQAGELALQSAGLPGWTLLHCDVSTVLPAAPARQATEADFAPPTFAGYASLAVTLTGGYVDGTNGPVFAITGQIKFVGPAAGGGADVLGGYLSDGTTHEVWAWFVFDSPLALSVATDVAAFSIKLFQNGTANVDVVE